MRWILFQTEVGRLKWILPEVILNNAVYVLGPMQTGISQNLMLTKN